jgi:hypothetical protein
MRMAERTTDLIGAPWGRKRWLLPEHFANVLGHESGIR